MWWTARSCSARPGKPITPMTPAHWTCTSAGCARRSRRTRAVRYLSKPCAEAATAWTWKKREKQGLRKRNIKNKPGLEIEAGSFFTWDVLLDQRQRGGHFCICSCIQFQSHFRITINLDRVTNYLRIELIRGCCFRVTIERNICPWCKYCPNE